MKTRLLAALLTVFLACLASEARQDTRVALLDEVDRTMSEFFYDPALLDAAWRQRVADARSRIERVGTPAQTHAIIQDLLASLKTSHTAIYAPDNPFYYFLASTFGRGARGYERVFGREPARMPDAGFLVETNPQGVFVQSILEGGPADRAGLRVGDRVVSVAGGPWRGLTPFRVAPGQRVSLQLQSQSGGAVRTVAVTPRSIDPQEAFLQASRASVKVLPAGGRKVGYYHIWAFTDPRIYEQFQDLLHRDFRGVDGFILDLRDGIGGGFPDLLYPFLSGVPRVEFTDRSGRASTVGGTWTRPVVVLINQRSRSSKELYAYGFSTLPFATLVGTRTAGAVTAGRAFFMQDGSLLYVAVSRVAVEGRILEGVGVAPDVEVARPIPFSEGRDPQMQEALRLIQEKLHNRADGDGYIPCGRMGHG